MSNYILDLLVQDGRISSGQTRLTADSVEYVVAAFTFDESWNDLTKTAMFRVDERVYHVPLEEDRCTVPFEVLQDGTFYLSVFGLAQSLRATTTEWPILVEKSGYTICQPSAPTPDPYHYFLQQVEVYKIQAEGNADRSEQAANRSSRDKEAVFSAKAEVENIAQQVQQQATMTEQASESVSLALSEVTEAKETILEKATEVETDAEAVANARSEVTTAVTNSISLHNQNNNLSAHPHLLALATEAKNIALGKSSSLCFATEEELQQWIAGNYIRPDGRTVADLKVGDNLYILALDVPDYWWDGTTAQPLGAERPDLIDYYTKHQIDARIGNVTMMQISRADYDAAYATGNLQDDCIYFVTEEEGE